MIAFLDASALIYLLEGKAPFADSVRAALAVLLDTHPHLRLGLSRLCPLECRVQPLKAGDRHLLARYDEFFARPDLIWVDLDRNVIELATLIRARHGLRTPDALHAACCLQLPTHVMLTGDAAFQRVPGLSARMVG